MEFDRLDPLVFLHGFWGGSSAFEWSRVYPAFASESHHVNLKQLWSYLTNYPYLPRLKNADVLLKAVQDGVSGLLWSENFACATRWDEAKQRYVEPKAGTREPIAISLSDQTLLVRPEIAQRQFDQEEAARRAEDQRRSIEPGSPHPQTNSTADGIPQACDRSVAVPPAIKKVSRFYGSTQLDPMRLNRDVGQITQAVMQHLIGLGSWIQ